VKDYIVFEFRKSNILTCECGDIKSPLIDIYNEKEVDNWFCTENKLVIDFNDIEKKIFNQENCVAKGFIMASAELEMSRNKFIIRLKDGTICVTAI
jgi:hypothetical protein